MTDSSCTCLICVGACRYKPGWFLPGELETAAAIVGMDEKTFFRSFCAVDWWEDDNDRVFILAPATVGPTGVTPGGMYNTDPRGRCILFGDDDRCRIHGAHPFECRTYIHTDTREDINKRHASVAEAWSQQQHEIERLRR